MGARLLLTTLLLSASASVAAERAELPWPNRNGPRHDSHALPEDAAGLPLEWDESSGRNIAWKTALEETGHSTPVIGEGRIWFTSATADGTRQYIDCVDERSGKVLRHQLLFENVDPEPLGNPINTYASPSCVFEPGTVYAHFGTYGTARLDTASGKVLWERRDIHCRHFRGPGSSPILFEDLLILTFDGIDQQFLIALDKQTGETIWRTERSTDYGDLDPQGQPRADGDYRKSYSTPALVEVAGRTQLISVGSRAAFGYDARTGEEIWTITHDDYNAAAPPLFFSGHAILNTGSGGANMVCVKLDETTRGNVDETHVVWNRPRGNSDLSSPVLVDGRVFMIANNGVAVCLDAATGEEIWKDRIAGTFVASPVVAEDRIYFANEEGVVTVIRASDQFEVLARNQLAEGMRASPAIAEGALFLRTFGHLYRISSPTP